MARPRDPNLERTWQHRLERQSHSRMSIAAFCAREMVSTASFHAWKRRLAAQTSPARSASPLFVPLQLSTLPHQVDRSPHSAVELELPHQVLLRFDSPPEPEWLGRVVAALAHLSRQELTP